MDATAESEAVTSEHSKTPVSDDDEMEASTSSDGGSTIKQLNEQLLAGEGNTGSVSIDSESVVPGNTNSSDDDGQWNRITRERKKSKSNEASTSASGTGSSNAKKGRVDSGLLVYLKGVDFDIAKEASRNPQPLEFSCKLTSIAGAVGEVKLLKDSVRITCVAVGE